MNACFKFLGKNYDNERELAKALADNYADALNYVFTEEFLNCFSDTYLRGRVVAELRRCRYAESALAMIIYLLNPELGLCVKGKFFMSLKDLATYMYYNSQEENLTIVHLFLDHAITHTLALAELENIKLKKDIVYVEDHIEDPAIYEYFIDLFDVRFKQTDAHGLTKFDYFLYGISNKKDKFQAFLELLDDSSFKSSLYSTFGISYILSIYEKPDYPYVIFNLLKEKTTMELDSFTGNGVHVWILSHIKNYKYYGVARKIKSKMKKLYKLHKKTQLFDERLNNSSRCYELYKCFTDAYEYGFISAIEDNYAINYQGYKNKAPLAYLTDLKLPIENYNFIEKLVFNRKDKKSAAKILKKRLSLLDNMEVELPIVEKNTLTKEEEAQKKEQEKLDKSLKQLEETRAKIAAKKEKLNKKYGVNQVNNIE